MFSPPVAGKIFRRLSTLWVSRLRPAFVGRFPLPEKYLLLLFTVVALGGIGTLGYQKYSALTEAVPAPGGHYIEGIVGNRSQFTDLITRLTSVGLVTLNAEGEYLPVLAKDWTISSDGKVYTFHLQDGVDVEEVAAIIRAKELFKTVEAATPDRSTLVLRLKQPFGPFLSLLAQPLFPYGPYAIESEKENEITLRANSLFPLGRPYLDRITIRIFPDEQTLLKAVSRQELSGAVTNQNIPGWIRYQSSIPRTISAILNTASEKLSDGAIRAAILAGESLSNSLSLTVVTTPQLKTYAEEFLDRVKKQNVDATLRLVDDAKLRQEVIPKRDYDILIYGMDFGIEPDPFRFWHSSQATAEGLNLAQLKDKGLDAMLEEARKIINDDERFSRYEAIEKRLAEMAVLLTLEKLSITYQISPAIKGVEKPLLVTPASRYNLVWKWYTNERRVLKTQDGGQRTE